MLDPEKLKIFIQDILVNQGITNRQGYTKRSGFLYFHEHYEIEERCVAQSFFNERSCRILRDNGEIIDSDFLKAVVQTFYNWETVAYEDITESQILNFCHVFNIPVRNEETHWCILDELQSDTVEETPEDDAIARWRAEYQSFIARHLPEERTVGRWSAERYRNLRSTLAEIMSREYGNTYATETQYPEDLARLAGFDLESYMQHRQVRLSEDIRHLYTESENTPPFTCSWDDNPWLSNEEMHEEDLIDWNSPEWTELNI